MPDHGPAQLPAPGPAGQSLLLTEDAVYAATRAAVAASGVAAALMSLKVYALLPDLAARGMAGQLVDGVTAIGTTASSTWSAEHPNNSPGCKRPSRGDTACPSK